MLRGVLFFLLVLVAFRSGADSWLPPGRETYHSGNGEWRLTVVPRALSGALDYFQDKVDRRDPAGLPQGATERSPVGILERKQGNRWILVWQQPLVNEIAPTGALVANDGRHVVTFDNWHSIGHGDDTIVLYDAQGQMVRAMGLDAFLPPDYIDALPRTVSSLHWGGGHRLLPDNETLVLRVNEPGDRMGPDRYSISVPVRVRLRDGEVTQPGGPEWHRAKTSAQRVRWERERREREFCAKRAAPVVAPDSSEKPAWQEYSAEVTVRAMNLDDGIPYAFVLPAENSTGFAEKRAGYLTAWEDQRLRWAKANATVFFFSPSSPAMAALMEEALAPVASGAMQGAMLVFVGEESSSARIRAAVERTGATYRFIDMRQPLHASSMPPRCREKKP